MKKVNKCIGAGYKVLQLNLLAGTESKCPVCQDLLKRHDVTDEGLQEVVWQFLSSSAKIPMPSAAPTCAADDALALASHSSEIKQEPLQGPEEESSRTLALAYLKTLEPTMTLLAAGSFGKRVPVRCNICKPKTWPDGRVLELGNLQVNNVKHFITQHLSSQRHRSNMLQLENLDPAVEQVECAGLSVNNAEVGDKLYKFRAEFELWAVHSNFEGCASHQYFYNASDRVWTVRSADCLKVCDRQKPGDHVSHVCTKCVRLGGSHGASCRESLRS